MLDKNTKFLAEYAKLETTLRDKKSMQVKDYEETLSEFDAPKLRYCRQTRNFLSHEEDGRTFVSATEEMTNFVSNLCWKLDEGQIPCKKKMQPVSKALTPNSTLQEAIKIMGKNSPLLSKSAVVADKGEVVGCISSESLTKAISDGILLKPTTKIKTLLKYVVPAKKMVMASIGLPLYQIPQNTPALITEQGKVVGFIL